MDDIKVTFDETEDIKTTLDVGSIQYGQLEIGTTTTGEEGTKASVTNTGSPAHAILNFTIPKGDKGDKGDAGAIKFIAVAELPTSNIDESAIYMKPSSNQEENNTYEEFIYTDGKWESLGVAQVKVDLEPYATKEGLKQLQDNVEEVFNGEESMGSIVVEDVECKNVLKKYLLMDSTNYTEDLGNSYKGYKLQLKPNTTYTLSCYYNDYVMSGGWECRLFDSNKNYVEAIQSGYLTNRETIKTFTTDNIGVMYIGTLYANTDRLQSFFSIIDIQLEKGPIATDVVEHKEFNNKQIYSTTEQVIGEWLGKPLYRKVILLESMGADGTTKSVAHGITNMQMGRIVDVFMQRGENQNSGNFQSYSVGNVGGSYNNTKVGFDTYLNATTINVYVTGNRSEYNGFAIIEYTKTTD